MYTWTSASRTMAIRHRDGANVPYSPAAKGNADYEELKAYIENGGVPNEPDVTPITEADYAAAIQSHIDATARARQYNDAVTCASYAASTTAAWAADAAALIAWRDAVWLYAFTQLAAVQAGQRAQPTIVELIDELPAISWPV